MTLRQYTFQYDLSLTSVLHSGDVAMSAFSTAQDGGGAIAVWTQTDGVSPNGLITARFISGAGGFGAGAYGIDPFGVSGSAFSARDPAVAALPNQSFVVAYTYFGAFGTETGDGGIRASIFTPSGYVLIVPGTASDTSFQVNTTSAGLQERPVITVLTDGSFVILWNDRGTGQYDVKAQHYASNGTRIGGEFTVNDPNGFNQVVVGAAALSNGGYAVAYFSSDPALDGSESGVGVRIVQTNGAMGAEIRVNGSTIGYQAAQSITALANGGFVVVWEDRGNASFPASRISAQIFDDNGGYIGPEITVTNSFSTPSSGTASKVTHLSNGGFLVAWQTIGAPGDVDLYGIAAQEFSALGAAVGPAVHLNAGTAGSQSQPEITTLQDGRVLVGLTNVGPPSDTDFIVWDPRDGNIFGTNASETLRGSYDRNGQADTINDIMNGRGGDDVLLGFGGDDVLNGDDNQEDFQEQVGAAGGDSLYGGDGNDLLFGYLGNNTLDGGEGFDTARYSFVSGFAEGGIDYVSADLAAGVAVFYSLSQNTGGAFEARASDTLVSIEALIGSPGDDYLFGDGAVSNTFDGGAGADRMEGRDGNDNYYINNAGDIVIEAVGAAAGAADVMFASVSFAIAANVERLVLTGGQAINAIGRAAQNDTLLGNSGNNVLNGLSGNDLMRGGLGNDTYYVDSISDTTDEVNGGGGAADFVISSVSYTAAAGIERLYLSGSSATNATGRAAQNDMLFGNTGNNVLNGLSGGDFMRGGLGNDTYYVDSASDTTDEVSGGGGAADFVVSSVSYTAAAGIERLYLGGSLALNATGRNGQNDILTGNTGSNTLAGLSGNDLLIGGLGNDTLSGGLGLDTFRFDTIPNAAANRDTINDFVAVDDTISLENALYTALVTTGTLAASAFNTGTAATQTDDRIIYNSATGALLYDVDGLDGVAGVQFATLSSLPAGISASDFVVT